jgi:hypothetical protein
VGARTFAEGAFFKEDYKMKRSGRRSAADLAAPAYQPTIRPTRNINAVENAAWAEVIGAWPPDHWIGSDARLLTQYCAFCAQLETALEHGAEALAGQLARVVMAYATKLRITPQSRYHKATAGTAAAHGRENTAAIDDDGLLGGAAWPSTRN